MRTECSRTSHFLHTVQLRVSVLGSFLLQDASLIRAAWALIYGYSRMLSGVILLLSSVSRRVFGFSLGPWTVQSQVLGRPRSVRHGFHFMDLVLMPEMFGVFHGVSLTSDSTRLNRSLGFVSLVIY